MQLDQAHTFSAALAAAGYSHTLHVRAAERYLPPVVAHISVALNELRPDIAGRVAMLDALAAKHGLALDTGLLQPSDISFIGQEEAAQRKQRAALGV